MIGKYPKTFLISKKSRILNEINKIELIKLNI